jgi:hypothetical protein
MKKATILMPGILFLMERVMIITLQAGKYFDAVTIKQEAK